MTQLAGQVDANGQGTISHENFTAGKISEGHYKVTYTGVTFASQPVVILTIIGAPFDGFTNTLSKSSKDGFEVSIRGKNPISKPFNFIATGPSK